MREILASKLWGSSNLETCYLFYTEKSFKFLLPEIYWRLLVSLSSLSELLLYKRYAISFDISFWISSGDKSGVYLDSGENPANYKPFTGEDSENFFPTFKGLYSCLICIYSALILLYSFFTIKVLLRFRKSLWLTILII